MAQEVMTQYAELAVGNRRGLLEGLAAEFLRETGLNASECELVERSTETGLRWFFRKRPELRTLEEAMASVFAKARQLGACQTVQQNMLAAAITDSRYRDAIEFAWTIIANAGGGNWKNESADWQTAAARFRDECVPLMHAHDHIDEVPESLEGWPCSAGFAPRVAAKRDNRTLNVVDDEIQPARHDTGSAQTTVNISFTCGRCKLRTDGQPASYLADQPLCEPCDREVLSKQA